MKVMTILNPDGVDDLPEQLRDFAKQDRPVKEDLKAILHRAAEEIQHLRRQAEETANVLSVYFESSVPWEDLMDASESRAEWMRDELPALIREDDQRLLLAAIDYLEMQDEND